MHYLQTRRPRHPPDVAAPRRTRDYALSWSPARPAGPSLQESRTPRSFGQSTVTLRSGRPCRPWLDRLRLGARPMRQKRILTSSAALHKHTTLAYWLPGCDRDCDACLACISTATSNLHRRDSYRCPYQETKVLSAAVQTSFSLAGKVHVSCQLPSCADGW